MKTKKKLREGLGVVDYICKRKEHEKYTLVFVAGLPGTGKSSACIRLAELISKKLTGENKIKSTNVFDDFLGLVSFVKQAKQKDVNIGVIEEVSVLFPSKRAMSGENVDINKVLDTARKKEVILFANAPLWNTIDSHMKALGNIYIETLSIDKKNSWVISKPLGLQTNPKSGKTYYHRFAYKDRDIHRIITKKPNQETWNEYEKKKDKFMDLLYEKAIHRNKKKNEKELKELGLYQKKKENQPLNATEMEVYNLYNKKGLTHEEISEKVGKCRSRITGMLQEIDKKMGNTPKE